MRKYIAILLLSAAAFAACRKQDDYKKYLEGGERLYTGKADSMRVHPGRNRVQVSWLLIADPKVSVSKLYWNNRKDSAIIPINRTKGIDTIRYMVNNLDERVYEFEVVNYDKAGNISMISRANGLSYGQLYETSLLNRAYESIISRLGKTDIKWGDVDSADGLHSIQIRYAHTNGTTRDTIVESISEQMVTSLPGLAPNSKLEYRTRYLPDTLAIDTFLTDWQLYQFAPELDLSVEVFKNPGWPFRRGDGGDSRFGKIADWQTNAEADRNGTTDEMNGAGSRYLTLWIWDNGPITNGKIWQTLTLPPGKYRMEAFQQNIDGTLQATYFAVAPGTTLPDVEQIGTAIASKKLTDNSDKHHIVTFTITEPKTVSLGFVGTFSNPIYQTLRVEGVKFFQSN